MLRIWAFRFLCTLLLLLLFNLIWRHERIFHNITFKIFHKTNFWFFHFTASIESNSFLILSITRTWFLARKTRQKCYVPSFFPKKFRKHYLLVFQKYFWVIPSFSGKSGEFCWRKDRLSITFISIWYFILSIKHYLIYIFFIKLLSTIGVILCHIPPGKLLVTWMSVFIYKSNTYLYLRTTRNKSFCILIWNSQVKESICSFGTYNLTDDII